MRIESIVVLVGIALAWPVAAAERPSILFILTDDQAPWALGVAGNALARTPNTDRLLREGAYLANAFTPTPVCSPSRASLMTSRYGSELGITDWIHPQREPDLGLDPATVTWPEVLAAAGYETGLVGKWHLGTLDRFHPTRTGFGYFMGFREGGTRPKDPVLEKDGEKRTFEGLTTDILTDHALEFLERHRSRTFLLCVHYRAPHAPWLPVADEDWAPYDGLDPAVPNPDYPSLDVDRVKKVTREYLASVAGVDRNLGRILGKLDELDLARRTVVVYASDHGYNMGHNGIWHKGNGHWILKDPPPGTERVPRGQRPNMFDHSIRVPAAVRWPGVVEPGTVITETITFLDFYPTILAIAGAPRPDGVTLRGRDFTPLLRGERVRGWQNGLYAEYSTHHQTRTHMRMYRTPQWKLVRDFLDPSRDELYHLAEDPAERVNLIRSERADARRAVDRLHRRILENMKENGDSVLEAAPESAR